jgi:hypothetical protein
LLKTEVFLCEPCVRMLGTILNPTIFIPRVDGIRNKITKMARTKA